jgi:hypothetical protein
MSDESDAAERDVASVSTDGHSVQLLSPSEQAVEDRRQAERSSLKKSRPILGFFRMFRISSRDVP